MKRLPLAALLSLLPTLALAVPPAPPATVYNIPRLDHLTIDGNPADWKDAGFRINILADKDGKTKPPADLDAKARLAYDDRGLLFLISVTDDTPTEAASHNLWEVDSVEMFIADKPASNNYYQIILSPGMDPKQPNLRLYTNDLRKNDALKQIKINPQYARTPLLIDGKPAGYHLEVLLPWDQIGLKPEKDRQFAFQFYVNDRDASGPASDRFKLIWHPESETNENPTGMYALNLSDQPSAPQNALARASYERFRRTRVTVTAPAAMAGQQATASYSDNSRPPGVVTGASATMAKANGRATASLVLPLMQQGPLLNERRQPISSVPPMVEVSLDSTPIAPIPLPDIRELKAKTFLDQNLTFPAILISPEFPKFEFEQPSLVEDLIGEYQINTTFYDANYNEVKTAQKPGRYGAVITITNNQGLSTRRFRTLFRTTEDFRWWLINMPVTVEFPKQVGLDPTVVKEQLPSLQENLKWAIVDGAFNRGFCGEILAGLYETKPNSPSATVYDDALARDRAWWLTLKRKLNGSDKAFTTPVQGPVPINGTPATVLHTGTLEQARMKPDTVQKLDALLKQWAADSDQGFNVCVVRDGIIVHHAAYGTRDGKPFSTDTKSYLASITKIMSGTAMMMAVDQGLISLDDPADKFLPTFRNPAITKQPLIRQLYTHTAGMWGHRDQPENDLAEVLASYAPYLEIGQKHVYNGTSLAVGSSILELVSGETLPAYYQKHLFTPLGMKNMDVTNSSYNAQGTAYDLAILAQMLLNKGAYGNLRFMKPETAQQQLPHRLVKEQSADSQIEWGIGLAYMNKEKTAVGHGSATSSTFHFYPAQNLIITMTRNGAGNNFGKYNPLFLQLVQDCLAESPATQPTTQPK